MDKNYRKYLDKITEGYKIYHETEEFIYEASLDLKQFFPSLNPLLLYQDILTSTEHFLTVKPRVF